jgi:hypothetical protein
MNTGDLFGQYIEPALGGATVVVIMVVEWLWRHPGVMNLIVLIAITNFVVNWMNAVRTSLQKLVEHADKERLHRLADHIEKEQRGEQRA